MNFLIEHKKTILIILLVALVAGFIGYKISDHNSKKTTDEPEALKEENESKAIAMDSKDE